jgi:hypothetical protein
MGSTGSPVTAGSPGLGGNVQQQRNAAAAAAAVNMTPAAMLRQQEQQMYQQVGGVQQQVFAQQYPQLGNSSGAGTGAGQPDSDFLNQFLRESQFRAAQQQQQQQQQMSQQQVPFSDPAIMAAKMGEAARLRVFENVSTTSSGGAGGASQQQWAQQQRKFQRFYNLLLDECISNYF